MEEAIPRNDSRNNMNPSFKIRLVDRLSLFFYALIASFIGSPLASQNLELSTMTNMVGGKGALGGSGKKSLGEIILFVLILFIVFLFATSGIIANSNIQTQLKNGAYYGGLFASVVVILIVLAFIL